MGLHIINFLECIQSCVMCMNIEIASIIFEICIVPEPATTSGTGLLLDRDTGVGYYEVLPFRKYGRTTSRIHRPIRLYKNLKGKSSLQGMYRCPHIANWSQMFAMRGQQGGLLRPQITHIANDI